MKNIMCIGLFVGMVFSSFIGSADNVHETIYYWPGTDVIQCKVYYSADWDWLESLMYYYGTDIINMKWLTDANPGLNGDMVYYQYDNQARLMRSRRDDGGLVVYKYWLGTSALKYRVDFGPQYAWRETIEYFEDGISMSAKWMQDANPGQAGDVIQYVYNEQGSIVEKVYDDTSREKFEFYADGQTLHYYMCYAAGYVWEKTIEYQADGVTMLYQWVADANPGQPGDAALYTYDTVGRLIEQRNDDQSMVTWKYWPTGQGTGIRYYSEYGPGYDWIKTIEYWEDGVTIHYQWLADTNPGTAGEPVLEEYDSTGVLIYVLYDDGSTWGTSLSTGLAAGLNEESISRLEVEARISSAREQDEIIITPTMLNTPFSGWSIPE